MVANSATVGAAADGCRRSESFPRQARARRESRSDTARDSLQPPRLRRHRKERGLLRDANASSSGIKTVWRSRRIDRLTGEPRSFDEASPGVWLAVRRRILVNDRFELVDLIERPELQERSFGVPPQPWLFRFCDLLPEEASRSPIVPMHQHGRS